MEWTDAFGVTHTGQLIPTLTTDTTGAALPSGSIRWKNLGTDGGMLFDLLVTVSSPASAYSDYVDVSYVSPLSSTTSQALFTTSGFACLGVGLQPSYCLSGASLDAASATCKDGTQTTMRGAEFDFRFVRAGTSEPMGAFERMYTTFFDVDGDTHEGWSVFELNAIMGAASRSIAPSAEETLEAGMFAANEALYAIATQSINVPTDFNANPANPPEVSLPAIVSFDVT